MSREFAAKYAGRCRCGCNGEIKVGDTCVYVGKLICLASHEGGPKSPSLHKEVLHEDIYWSNKAAELEREQERRAFLSDPW